MYFTYIYIYMLYVYIYIYTYAYWQSRVITKNMGVIYLPSSLINGPRRVSEPKGTEVHTTSWRGVTYGGQP